jgi:hypothetical protein
MLSGGARGFVASRRLTSEFCRSFRPRRERRARGMPGASRTHGPPAEKSRRQSPQVQPKTPGIPRAMVFTLMSRSPRCAGLIATVAFGLIITRKLSASVGAPGPRVFTSATCRSSARPEERAATDRGHRIPRSTVRDDRETPLQRARDGVEHRSDLPDDTSVAACDRVARRAICAGLGCGASRHGTSPASTETAAMGQGPTLMLAVRHRP